MIPMFLVELAMKCLPFAALFLLAGVLVVAANRAADKAEARARPAIDTQVPAELETATFALG
jgi:hypothetical protein